MNPSVGKKETFPPHSFIPVPSFLFPVANDVQSVLESKIDALQEELAKFDGLTDIPGVLEA